MKTLEQVRNQLASGAFRYSRHALKRVVERNVTELEIRQAGEHATIIEEYPEDKYSPSCLLLGFTGTGRPLHFQVSLAHRVRQNHHLVRTERKGLDKLCTAEVNMFTCAVCGAAESREEPVNEVFQVDGKYVRVDHIPARVCGRCGDETFSRETTEKVRLLVHGQARPTKSVALEIFEFA